MEKPRHRPQTGSVICFLDQQGSAQRHPRERVRQLLHNEPSLCVLRLSARTREEDLADLLFNQEQELERLRDVELAIRGIQRPRQLAIARYQVPQLAQQGSIATYLL